MPSANATLQLVANQGEVKEERNTSGAGTDGFQMPSLAEIKGASQVANEMTEEELDAAYQAASELDFSDPINAMKFGLADQEVASKVTREFMKTLKDAGLEDIGVIAKSQNEKMEELKIGDLKPGFFKGLLMKFLPQEQAKRVTKFLEKHQSLSEVINEGEQAQAIERIKLEKLQEQMRLKIAENNETYKRMTGLIAQAELKYAADVKKVAEYKEANKDSQSQAKVREMNLMDQALAMASRRVNSLKASRQETLNALSVMDLQVNRIHSQMQMIDEQRSFNRMVWDNSVLMAATNSQMDNSVRAITFNRQSVEKMMKERSAGIPETLKRVIAEEKAGVVNAAVLEYAALELMRMNKTIINGNKEIRDNMAEADNIIKRLDAEVKDVMKHAAAMSADDLAKLDALFTKVDPSGEPVKPAEGPQAEAA